jgi:cell wall-associated NlpC family hydrolase
VILALTGALVLLLVYGNSESTASNRKHSNGTGRAILSASTQYIGRDYGHGPKKFKCTGLTSAAVKQVTGVVLPLDPAAQMSYGWQPRKKKRGDVVFFDEYGNGVSHVGVYAGNGELVHASKYFDAVVKSEMKYINGLAGVGRVR